MRHLAFALLPLFLAAGCSTDAPTAPPGPAVAATAATQTIAQQTVVRSATGTGHLIVPAGGDEFFRNFAFAALEREDGSVHGEFEFTARQLPIRVHGRVTCLAIVGNTAWIGGVIEQMIGSLPNPAIGPGTPVVWRAVDNGEGEDTSTDLISGLQPRPAAGADLAYCAARPPAPPLFELDAGTVQIRN